MKFSRSLICLVVLLVPACLQDAGNRITHTVNVREYQTVTVLNNCKEGYPEMRQHDNGDVYVYCALKAETK